MGNGISIGTQLVAPDGFLDLEKGVTYYFLKSSSDGLVYLVDFVARPARRVERKRAGHSAMVNQTPTPIPVLLVIARDDFESGLDERNRRIVRVERQHTLPPWLEELEGQDLSRTDQKRRSARVAHVARIERKLELISPLVRVADQVLGADDPDHAINAHARACTPRQNETRLRLAFYVYLLFGRNRFALHYPIHKIGRWDRDRASDTKRGRPSERKGKGHGHNATPELVQKMLDCYARESGPGVDLPTIYRTFMSRDLGCRERPDRNGCLSYWHPQGAAFPTKGMFLYHVRKAFGTAQLQRTMLGYARTRSKFDAHLGAFTQNLCNAHERVEADAYVVRELPRGLIDGHTLPALRVVRFRDVASGLITGIGFALGSETAAAYRMARFCQAVDKVLFCSLFGVRITADQWPSIGLTAYDVQDRGPGATDGAFARHQACQPVVREIPPSYAGQSKAIVESSHPKSRSTDDAPSHVKSNMRVFELIRRELWRVIRDNDSINIADRIPPDLLSHVCKPSPLALFRELDRRGRNDAMSIGFGDAVRTFLSKHEARLTRDGIMFKNQCYSGPGLVASGALRRRPASQASTVEVYVLDACVRHIWIDIDDALVQLEIKPKLRVADEEMYLSLDELMEREEHLRTMALDFDEHRDAVASKRAREFEVENGLRWNGGSRIVGRPRWRTEAAKREAAESKLAMQGKVPA